MLRAALASGHPWLEGITYERFWEEGYVRLNRPDDWRPFAEGGFATPSGKAELYSGALREAGTIRLPWPGDIPDSARIAADHRQAAALPQFRLQQQERHRRRAGELFVEIIDYGDHKHVAAGRPVVLAIGDSMTFGEGVTAEQAWPAVLERALGARVYAAGVPGYGSPQMRVRLQRLLPALRPDLVIVALSPHWDQQRCAAPFVYKGGYIVGTGYADKLHLIHGNLYVADVRWPVVGTATAWTKRYSHVARLALPAVRAAAGAITDRGRGQDPDAPGDVSATAATLVGIRGDVAAAGSQVLVVFLDSRGKGYEADRDALASALRPRNVPYLALDELIAAREWPRLRFARDHHWNAAGHRRVGEILAPQVRPLLNGRAI